MYKVNNMNLPDEDYREKIECNSGAILWIWIAIFALTCLVAAPMVYLFFVP
jgi:hypothetical protein